MVSRSVNGFRQGVGAKKVVPLPLQAVGLFGGRGYSGKWRKGSVQRCVGRPQAYTAEVNPHDRVVGTA